MSDFTTLRKQLAQKRADHESAARELAVKQEQLKRIERELAELTRFDDGKDRARGARIKDLTNTAKVLRDEIERDRRQLGQISRERRTLLGSLAALADPADQVRQLSDTYPILLFPLRLETRFKQVLINGQPRSQLWVRVYPDDCQVDSFEDLLSESEVNSARSFWVEMWKAGGIEEQERSAWRALVGSYGSGRAAWIVQQYAPLNAKPAKVQPQDIVLTIIPQITLTPAEEATAGAFWVKFWQANGDSALQEEALDDLSKTLGADKISAILSGFKPENLDQNPPKPYKRADVNVSCLTIVFDPTLPSIAKTSSWTQAPRARALPDRLVLMCFNGGVEVQRIVGQPIPDNLATGPDPSLPAAEQLQLKDGELVVNEALRWTVDFEQAAQVGMGFKVDLTATQAKSGFERLFVLGVRVSAPADESQELLERLLLNHHHSKHGFSLVPQGSPTNNTEGAGAAYTWIDDADASYDIIFKGKEAFVETKDPLERRDGEWLAYALGIRPDILKNIPHAGDHDQAEARAMQSALWPATLGYMMEEMLTPIFSASDIAATRRFFTGYVTGRGPFPAVRVGRQPYGILPAMAFVRYKSGPRLDRSPLPISGQYLAQLHSILMKMNVEWTQQAKDVAHVGQPGDPHQLLLDIIGLHAGSVEYHQRYAQSFQQLYNTLVIQLKGGLGALLAVWLSQRGAQLLQQLGYSNPNAAVPILRKFFRGKQHLLDGPVVDEAPLSETLPLGQPAGTLNYIEWLASTSVETIRLQDFGGKPVPKALLYLLLRHALLLAQWDAGVRFLANHQLIDPVAARLEPAFIHVQPPSPTAGQSKFAHLYRVEPLITGNDKTTLAEYIMDPGVLSKAIETSDLRALIQALHALIDTPTARLERLFSEHLDCCSYRLDAWKTGIAATRLEEMRHLSPGGTPSEAVLHGLYLGAYGWLENVKPENKVLTAAKVPADLHDIFEPPGQPPPMVDSTNAGYIHAPSLNHAATAAVLKNAYMVHASKTTPDIMAVNLSSERVRQGLGLLEGIRNGQSLAALLGYRFERGLHDAHNLAEVDKFIYPLRQKFPLVADRLSPTKSDGQTDIGLMEARNVIDGVRLINHIRITGVKTYPFGLPTGTGAGQLPSATPDEQQAINAEVDTIQNLNDAVADLVLAESVYQVVMGNFERAAANTQAFAKGRYPPEPEVTITPRSGPLLTHRVALHLDTTADPNTSPHAVPMTPRARAEAPLNQWLAQRLPDPANVACQVSYSTPALGAEQQIIVTQQDLGLQPLDLLYAANLELEPAMAELDGRIVQYVRYAAALNPHPGLALQIRYTEPVPGKISFFELAALLKSLRALLLKSRYVAPTDLALPSEAEASTPAYDFSELQARITNTIAGLTAREAQLKTLVADPSDLDAYALAASQLFLDVALYGAPQTGVGDIHDSIRAIYHAILGKVRELTKRWDEKSAEFNALMATWPTLSTDDERFALLLKTEELIASSPTTVFPASPTTYKMLVEATKTTFDTRLAGFKMLLTLNTNKLVDLITVIDALAPTVADHDTVAFDIEDQRQAAASLRGALVTRVTNLHADLAARISAATAELGAAATIDQAEGRVRSMLQAASRVLGDEFKLLPRFLLPELQGLELQNCWAGSAGLTDYLRQDRGRLFPIDDWLYGVARVREKLFHWENTLFLGEAFDRPALELTPLQLPYRPDDRWLALEFPADYVFDNDRLLYTAHFASTFDRDLAQCGLLIDEWTEVIPAQEEVTGLTFHFDRPNTEPPQAMLLAVPPGLTGNWQWDDLVAMLHETLDAARQRAVEPAQVDRTSYAQFLPATLMAVTLYQITLATNLAFNIDIYKKIG